MANRSEISGRPEMRDDIVQAEVVDHDEIYSRLDTWVFSRRDGGEANNDEIRVLDDLEQLTRMDDPEARYRYIEQLSVQGARTLLQRLGVNADEHEKRASLLARFRTEVGQHLQLTAEGSDPAMMPTPARAEAGPALKRPF